MSFPYEKYTFHPLTAIWPLIPERELEGLRSSLRSGYDYNSPLVVTDDNQILDGRNRFKICREEGIVPIIRVHDEVKDGPMLDFVYRANSVRRQLTMREMASAEVWYRRQKGEKITPSYLAKRYRLEIIEADAFLNANDKELEAVRDGKKSAESVTKRRSKNLLKAVKSRRGLNISFTLRSQEGENVLKHCALHGWTETKLTKIAIAEYLSNHHQDLP